MKRLNRLVTFCCATATIVLAVDNQPTDHKENFYKAVNQQWIETHTIPDDKGQINSFSEIDDHFIVQAKELMQKLIKKQHRTPDEERAVNYYLSYTDMKARNAKGIAPLKPQLARIDALKDHEALKQLLIDFSHKGLPTPYGFFAQNDPEDSDRYLLSFVQTGMGLQKKYYEDNSTTAVQKRKNYTDFLKEILTFSKVEDVNRTVRNDMKVETALAEGAYSVVEMSDVKKTTNLADLKKLDKILSHFGMAELFETMGYPKDVKINILTPGYFVHLNEIFKTIPLDVWKDYLKSQVILTYAGVLGEDFVQAGLRYNIAEGVANKLEPIEVRAIRTMNASALRFLFGKLYIESYFNEAVKVKVEKILHNVIATYKSDIAASTRFSPKTKKEALRKIETMGFQIAYPDKWHDYSSLTFKKDDLVANSIAMNRYSIQRDVEKVVKGKVDKQMWEGLPPQEINAYYSAAENKFILLAGILHPPFFDMNASDAANYGGIGLVIGHEVGHAFDKRGAQYDADGNLKNWWTKEDLDAFNKLNEKLIAQANAYEILPGVHANGKLQVTEIAADLSGAEIALQAYLGTLSNSNQTRIQGMRDFFIQYAKAWRSKTRPKLLIMLNDADAHPVAEYRVNGTVRNMETFYETFGVKEGDKMYLAPEKRVHFWTEKKRKNSK